MREAIKKFEAVPGAYTYMHAVTKGPGGLGGLGGLGGPLTFGQ
jgi:hypothetical protein